MTRVVLDLDSRFAFFPEFLRFAADRADDFNASLIREIADEIGKQQRPRPDSADAGRLLGPMTTLPAPAVIAICLFIAAVWFVVGAWCIRVVEREVDR